MFIFDKHKLSFYISTALWLRKYDDFDFSRDRAVDLVDVEIKRFDLICDHVIDISRHFACEVLSSYVTIQLSLGFIDLVKVEI